MEANLVVGITSRCFRAAQTVPQSMRLLAGLTAAVLLWCAVLFPAIGQAASNNAQAEIELGEKISKEVEKQYKLSPDKSQQERVQRLGRALARARGA